MASVVWDTGKALLDIWETIRDKNLEAMSKEELICFIQMEGNSARSSYIDLAVDHGWYEDRDSAEDDIGDALEVDVPPHDEEAYRAQVEQSMKREYKTHEAPEVMIRIRQWLADQNGWEDPYLIVKIVGETEKAVEVMLEEPFETKWFPKSMIISIDR